MTHQDTPSTAFVLTMRYQSTVIALEDVCRHYLPHLSLNQALRRAREQSLPFPVFRADTNSKKSPHMVRVSDLAQWLDSQAEHAQQEWEKVNA